MFKQSHSLLVLITNASRSSTGTTHGKPILRTAS